jgi:hypothetical protein
MRHDDLDEYQCRETAVGSLWPSPKRHICLKGTVAAVNAGIAPVYSTRVVDAYAAKTAYGNLMRTATYLRRSDKGATSGLSYGPCNNQEETVPPGAIAPRRQHA